jgi:hypothetical protein
MSVDIERGPGKPAGYAQSFPHPLYPSSRKVITGELDISTIFFHTSTSTTTTKFFFIEKKKRTRIAFPCGKSPARLPA